jgi:hypothetical protein
MCVKATGHDLMLRDGAPSSVATTSFARERRDNGGDVKSLILRCYARCPTILTWAAVPPHHRSSKAIRGDVATWGAKAVSRLVSDLRKQPCRVARCPFSR